MAWPAGVLVCFFGFILSVMMACKAQYPPPSEDCAPLGALQRGLTSGEMRVCEGTWKTVRPHSADIPFAEMYIGCYVDYHPIACQALKLFEEAAPQPLYFAPVTQDRAR